MHTHPKRIGRGGIVVFVFALALAVGLAGISSGSALATATPVSPPPGAKVGMRPTFSWSLQPGDVSDTVYVATTPVTDPSGAFY